MRIPKIKHYTTESEVVTQPVEELLVSKTFYNFGNNKEKVKFIKTTEVLIRSSLEYRELIQYLGSKLGMNYCSFFITYRKRSMEKLESALNYIMNHLHYMIS